MHGYDGHESLFLICRIRDPYIRGLDSRAG